MVRAISPLLSVTNTLDKFFIIRVEKIELENLCKIVDR